MIGIDIIGWFLSAFIGGAGIVGLLMIKPRRTLEKHYNQIDKNNERLDKIDILENTINDIKEENMILCYCVWACLKGLEEQGCDGPVHEGISKIETYMNEKAHS